MLCKRKRVVRVATTAELRNPHYYRRLWVAARNTEVSRRKWIDVLADCFRDTECHIVYPSGAPFPIGDLDALFGDDPDGRWFSYYLKSDPSGSIPSTTSRKLERVQIIDLYFRLMYPHIAVHFGR